MSVMVAGWEIECCAPQPAVGEIGRWRLDFVPAPEGGDSAQDDEHEWLAAPWPDAGSQSATCLSDGPMKMHWRHSAESPTPQRIRLRGRIFGTKHGGTDWDGFPR